MVRNNSTKKLLSLTLSIMLIFSIFPFNAFALADNPNIVINTSSLGGMNFIDNTTTESGLDDGADAIPLSVTIPYSQREWASLSLHFEETLTPPTVTAIANDGSSPNDIGYAPFTPYDFTGTNTTLWLKSVSNDTLVTKYYKINVSITPAETGKAITSFSFESLNPVVNGVIDEQNKTIDVNVPYGTDITNLVATFTESTNASVMKGVTPQVSNVTHNNFTTPIIYTVYAEDTSTVNYTVNVSITPATTGKSITSFSFEGLNPVVNATIDEQGHTITATVPYGTNITNLVGTFTKSPNSTVYVDVTPQVSGTTPNDFTNPVSFTVMAQDTTIETYIMTVNITPPTTGKSMTSFSFESLNPPINGVINEQNKTINVNVPYGTNKINLVATFTTSPNARVMKGAIPQVSGVTHNNFATPINYTVYAEDNSSFTYAVTVSIIPPTTDKEITGFSLEGLTPSVVGVKDEQNKTIDLTVPYGTDVTNLVATFFKSPYATVSVGGTPQVSSTTPNDFTNPVSYVVTAQDGSTATYTVNVIITPASTAKAITNFSFQGLNPVVNGNIDEQNKTIELTVPFGTVVSNLVATFGKSPNATVVIGGTPQVSGTTTNNFTNPVSYVVTAQDGSTTTYTVTVIKTPPSTAKAITSFSFEGLVPPVNGVIDEQNKTIDLTVPYGTDVTNLVATFTKSPISTIFSNFVPQTSGTTPNDFTNPVPYLLIAQDGSTADYTVNVIITPASTAKAITNFSFEGLVPSVNGFIDEQNKTINLTVPYGTNVSNLVATFTKSPISTVDIGVTPQVSGTTPNDFTNPVSYVVTAQDSSTTTYTVNVIFTPPSTQSDILTFDFNGIDELNKEFINNNINIIVPYNTDLTNLAATTTKSNLSTSNKDLSVGTDYSSPVVVRITAQDGITFKDFTINVKKYNLSFVNPNTDESGYINENIVVKDNFNNVINDSTLFMTDKEGFTLTNVSPGVYSIVGTSSITTDSALSIVVNINGIVDTIPLTVVNKTWFTTSAVFKNMNTNTNINALTANTLIGANVSVENKDVSDRLAMLVVVLYKDNQVQNISYTTKTVKTGETEVLNSGFLTPSSLGDGVYKVKSFVWNGTSLSDVNLKVVSNSLTLEE